MKALNKLNEEIIIIVSIIYWRMKINRFESIREAEWKLNYKKVLKFWMKGMKIMEQTLGKTC